jgi:hypothetical protein
MRREALSPSRLILDDGGERGDALQRSCLGPVDAGDPAELWLGG